MKCRSCTLESQFRLHTICYEGVRFIPMAGLPRCAMYFECT